MSSSKHDVHTFLRVQSKLSKLDGGIEVAMNQPLSKALENLSCFPSISLSSGGFDTENLTFSIGGQPAGSFDHPNVDLILNQSTPSPFGKGETTVMDEAYRRGKEIPASKIEFSDQIKRFLANIAKDVSAAMFIRRQVQLKLYKLAIYTEGGHFDWHMDSTHGDNHHATVLLALNTSWTGGDLVLRRDGVETRMGMHPKDMNDGYPFLLQMAAFYTDTEHKVEPVTEGVRIVLQFDVEVVGWSKNKDSEEGEEEEGEEEGEGEGEEETYSDYYMMDFGDDFKLGKVKEVYSRRKSHKGDNITGDPEAIKRVISIIKNILSPKVKEVGFAMQYLYRKSSILPEFLKGSDALLYQALAESFKVTLRPVVLQELTDYEGAFKSRYAYRFDQNGNDTDSSEEEWKPQEYYTHECDYSTIFHVPITSAIKRVNVQNYLEYTGNEAQVGKYKYFGGGMFVSHKETAGV